MTTRIQTLADGTTVKNVTEAREMRDVDGRTRREMGPLKDGEFKVLMVNLTDPVAHTSTIMFGHGKTAQVRHLAEPKPRSAQEEARLAEVRARAEAYRKEHPVKAGPNETVVENLPDKTIAGIRATGTRRTRVIPVGEIGNDREIKTVFETWYSSDLKVTLETSSDDPRMGKWTMVVSELTRGDPDASLFKVPADYKVTEEKSRLGGLQ
jgi:hypothetical protein